jgi:hypothetical protein
MSLGPDALREPAVKLLSARATEITFPMFNMTTGGLWRVEGTTCGASPGGSAAASRFSIVAKLLQSPLLWSGIGRVPPHFKDGLALHYPWRTEAQVYASDLAEAMPVGGRLSEIYNIERRPFAAGLVLPGTVRKVPQCNQRVSPGDGNNGV